MVLSEGGEWVGGMGSGRHMAVKLGRRSAREEARNQGVGVDPTSASHKQGET
jgi:hypothetical protein